MPALCLILAVSVGCEAPNNLNQDSARLTKIQQLEDQLATQAHLLSQQDQQLRDKAEMIQLLRGLGPKRKLEDLIHVDRIEIDCLSGGYDDDHDAVDEGVVVYLRLYDQYGGALRASGIVRVRMLDLAAPPTQQQVAQKRLTREELTPLWYGRFLTSHYTIKVPWREGMKRAAHKDITLLVSFTDLLSGRTFHAQKVVEVSIDGKRSP